VRRASFDHERPFEREFNGEVLYESLHDEARFKEFVKRTKLKP